MATYRLSCTCGRTLDIDPRQAGESLACPCGAMVEVPTLRKLRELPPSPEDVETPAAAGHAANRAACAGGKWGIRQGAIAAFLIVAAIAAVVAGVSWWNQPVLPKFDPAAYADAIEQRIDELAPFEAWRVWVENYQTAAAAGLTKFRHPATDAIERDIDRRWLLQTAMLAVVAACLVAAGVAWLTSPRTG